MKAPGMNIDSGITPEPKDGGTNKISKEEFKVKADNIRQEERSLMEEIDKLPKQAREDVIALAKYTAMELLLRMLSKRSEDRLVDSVVVALRGCKPIYDNKDRVDPYYLKTIAERWAVICIVKGFFGNHVEEVGKMMSDNESLRNEILKRIHDYKTPA